jgi:hypothetical protein
MLNKIIINNMLIYIVGISFGMPTSLPSSMPTTLPSSMPIFDQSFVPTGVPTIEPTGFPTINPTGFPTINPTGFPTINPTVDPTSQPSLEPSLEPIGVTVISFPASIEYTGITVALWNENIDENNDVACAATTKVLNIPKSGCQVTGLIDSNNRRVLQNRQLSIRELSISGVIVTTQLTVPIKNNESNSTYNILTTKLQQSIDDGSFTSAVINSATEIGSITLQAVSVPIQIVVVEPYVELSYSVAPSVEPSLSPSVAPSSKQKQNHEEVKITDKPIFIAVYISIFVFVVIVLYLVRQIRAKREAKREFIKSTFINDMSNEIITKLENALENLSENQDDHLEIVLFENTAQL